ncbi:MAG: hypothetical protein JWQ19_1362 [Subtercola sp.]|nr:hypothetical protein [Subtercola sp.]
MTAPPTFGRRAVAVVAAVVVPGSGHLLLGRRRVGLALTALSVVVIGAGAVAALWVASDPSNAAALLLSSGALLVAAIALISWAMLIVFCSFDLLREPAREPRREPGAQRAALTALTVVLVAALSGSLLTAAGLATTQRTTIDTIFAGGAGLVPVNGRYNILLAGTDVAPDRSIVSPDSIAVASVDAITGQTVIIGVARNTQNFPFAPGSALATAFPEGNYCESGCSLNHAYEYGVEHPQLYPGSSTPGVDALIDAVTGYTGLTIGGYVIIKMQGFVDLIDAIGGVTVQVNKAVPRTGVPNNGVGGLVVLGPPIEPGLQHMDGATALWFARSRLDSSDTERMIRQGCLQQALFTQLTPDVLLTKFDAIESSGAGLIDTNIPSASLSEFARLAVGAQRFGFTRIDLSPPLVVPEQPDLDTVHSIITDALEPATASRPEHTSPPSEPQTGVDSTPVPTVSPADGSGSDTSLSPICSIPLS